MTRYFVEMQTPKGLVITREFPSMTERNLFVLDFQKWGAVVIKEWLA